MLSLFWAGKYGSNIHMAFWRNVPFFVVPFWAASVLFSRPRQMPVITADKVGVRANFHGETTNFPSNLQKGLKEVVGLTVWTK